MVFAMASSISNIKCFFFCSRFSHYLEDYLEIYSKASVKNCVQNFSDLIVFVLQ